MFENTALGSRNFPSSSVMRGFCVLPSCAWRARVCETSIAEDHNVVNALLALVIPSRSNEARGPFSVEGLSEAKYFALKLHNFAKASIYSEGFTSEHHYLSHGLTFMQTIEAKVDLVELEAPAHQTIDGQLAASIELDVAGKIANRHTGADVAALDGSLLGDKIYLRQRKCMIGWRQPRRDSGSPAPRDFVGKIHCFD